MATPSPAGPAALTDTDLPELFARADAEAMSWKRRFLRLFRGQIALLCVGAVTGAASRYAASDAMTLVSLLSFLVVAAVRLYQRFSSTTDRWPAARWAAERTKSLAWSYAVGAEPFASGSGRPHEVRRHFEAALLKIFDGWPWGGTRPRLEDQVTPAMERLRAGPAEARRDAYLRGRVEEQAEWYESKARSNALAGRRWDMAFVGVSVAAIGGGVLQLAGLLRFDLLRLAGFAAAVIVSWTGLNRHRRQAKTYRSAGRDLRDLARQDPGTSEPASWSRFVGRVEAIIRREGAGWFEAHN